MEILLTMLSVSSIQSEKTVQNLYDNIAYANPQFKAKKKEDYVIKYYQNIQ